MSGHDGHRRFVGLLPHIHVADRTRGCYRVYSLGKLQILRGSVLFSCGIYRKPERGCKGEVSSHIRYLRLCCQSRFGEYYNFPSFFNVPLIVKCHNLPLLHPKMPRAPMRHVGNIGSSEVWTTAPVPYCLCPSQS